MLGCVVWLTSSHLSGSTIRDVNTVGCVLCSNSSFSSLLSSPNTDTDSSTGTVTRPGQDPDAFVDGTEYSFNKASCDHTSSTHHPLVHSHSTGTQAPSPSSPAPSQAFAAVTFKVERSNSSNFTSCSSKNLGGGMFMDVVDDVLITLCRFEHCSTTNIQSSKGGGGLFLEGDIPPAQSRHQQFKLIDCLIADCTATSKGAGVYVEGSFDLCVTNTKFEHCDVSADSDSTCGGGIFTGQLFGGTLKVEGCQFIACSSRHAGSAIRFNGDGRLNISDTLVKNCHSGTTGAITCTPMFETHYLLFSHILFDGNTVGDDTTYFTEFLGFDENETKFTDLAIFDYDPDFHPTFEFDDCFTTTSRESSGLIVKIVDDIWTGLFHSERRLEDKFKTIGPFLTAKPRARVNGKTGKIELEMMGKTPLPSQEYEVTVKGEDETDAKFKMLFADGTGTLNADHIEVPVAAWAFHLAVTLNFLTFTTPADPSFSTLQVASANLAESDPRFAFVVLHFDKEVSGSYDFVVLEDGEEVTLTITTEGVSKSGATKEFKVIGDGKLLTHDTTYTIKSIVPTAESEALFVWMNETIRFHIPKSSYVPPEEPEDPKKAMSPETKALLSWLLPLVGCLLIALVLAIIIIVLLRRRQKKSADPAQKEMEEQEPLDVEKVEEFGVDCSNGVIRTDGNDHPAFSSHKDDSSNKTETDQQIESEFGEVRTCSGDFAISTVRMDSTLYSVLHKNHREIGKRGVGLQIVNGLKHVVAHRPASDVLTRLSSHWILIDTSGLVQLKLQMTREEAEQEAARTQMLNPQQQPTLEGNTNQLAEMTQEAHIEKSGMDGLRWRAPEVVSSDGRSGVESVDGHKASVFSLGLVLWEIETGQVPFGELDAVNAQRQSGTGIGPKMDSLKNEEFLISHRKSVHNLAKEDKSELPKNDGYRSTKGLSVMFDVWNSTFRLDNLHLFATTPDTAVSLIRSSTFVRLIVVSVSESTNHLCGTSGMRLDWSGSSLLSNCSFTSCITNDAPDPVTEPISDPGKPVQSYISKETRLSLVQSEYDEKEHDPVWIMSCTFSDLQSTEGAAIHLKNYRADVVRKDCSFTGCLAAPSSGGAIDLGHSRDATSDKYSATLFNCQFTDNTAQYGGHLMVSSYKSLTIAQCTFTDSRSMGDPDFDQEDPMYLVGNTNTRFDNSTISNNEAGTLILTDVLFKDNVCTADEPSKHVTDCMLADNSGQTDFELSESHAYQSRFFDCFSTSALPHCGDYQAVGLYPDLIGPSITSVDPTIQENWNGDGFEVVLLFEGVFTGTSRKYDVTFEGADGTVFVAEKVSFSKTTGTATIALNNPNVPSLDSLASYSIVDVTRSPFTLGRHVLSVLSCRTAKKRRTIWKKVPVTRIETASCFM
ncbi:hypothetical protein BLNAU_2068 [Blattamonas nauphoetae]|uniref:Right handed beta helix domain-containing protein n=1 Tax=Blattamonas nauphoetae TaxID=2049346 RepID=A0ABQ9YH25_9EUKA|nr:hypothetical protein BLNAU_2068 [Blattamonas nauphoetae]